MNYVVSSFIDINDNNYDDDDFDSRTRAYYYNYYNTQLSYNGKETNTGEYEFLCQRYKIILYPPTGFRRLSLTVVITKRYKIDNQKVQYITVIV
jgi:hypothetical protein